jgi:hypothetical protein
MPLIEDLIAQAQERADALSAAAIEAANFDPPSLSVGAFTATVTAPGLRDNPPAYTGNVDISTDITQAFNEGFSQFKPEMLEAVADYIAKFFPACVYANTNDWICNTILYGGTGIPADIEAQIWSRARSRETAEASKLREVAVVQFAARGFMLPSGVLAARLQEIEQEASNKASTINRDIAIKQAEIEIENIRLAVQEGVKIRASVIAAIGDYMRAYMAPINLANERADLLARSKSVFLNSAADYYRAMIAEAELSLRAALGNLDATVTARTADNNLVGQYATTTAQILASAASSLSAAAGQAAGASLTLASDNQQAIVAAGG